MSAGFGNVRGAGDDGQGALKSDWDVQERKYVDYFLEKFLC